MSTKRLVVALLLLTVLGNQAQAAEPKEHRSKHARQLLATLDTLGISNRDIKEFVATIDSRIDKGYLRFSEQQVPMVGGKLTFRYRLNNNIDPLLEQSRKHGVKRLELRYAPSEDSRWEIVASRKFVMTNYRLTFEDFGWDK